MEMSVAGVAGQTQANVQNLMAVGMLKKTLDSSAQEGADLIKLIAQSSGVGQQVDQLA